LYDILVKNGTRDSIDIEIYTPTPIALPVAGTKVSQGVINLMTAISIFISYIK
jgi:hypothetical protein